MRKITRMIDFYIAIDGKVFESELECEKYEGKLLQSKKEKTISTISYDANRFDWPSMADPYGSEHEYKWVKIKNDEDLKRFCYAYKLYCSNLGDVEKIKKHISYPDYICLVDYPRGAEEPEWFILSELENQAKLFLTQFPAD